MRTRDELRHKENLINLGVARLPADWKYVAWVDADVQFARPDIVTETIQQLQHFGVVQMFSQATDLDPQHQPLKQFDGFVAQYGKPSTIVERLHAATATGIRASPGPLAVMPGTILAG